MRSLLSIKAYLCETKVVSLGKLAKHFSCDPQLMRQMLTHWCRKGCVRQSAKTPACGKGCGNCPISEFEMYEWISA